MNTVKLTMAQAIIRFLDQQYLYVDGEEIKFVDSIYSIFGHGNVAGLGEALEYKNHSLRFIRGSNEQGMVHTATAFAKQSKRQRIGVVTSSIGPGATNMVTGAATATINRIPVLLLPGDVFSCRQPDPVLQQLEDPHSHQTSVNDCFRPVSRYWDRIDRPEQIMSALLHAMRVLTDPVDTGAVTLCLPQDVQCESYDYPESFFKKRIHFRREPAPAQREIEAACEILAQAQKPLVIAGGGVRYAQASTALEEFCIQTKIPVAETQAGKGAILSEFEHNVGGVGVIGSHAANQLACEADVILSVGTRLGDFVTASKWGFKNPNLKIVSLNVSPYDGGKLDAELAITADARLGLNALTSGLKAKGYSTKSEYQSRVKQLRDNWFVEVARVTEPTTTTDGKLSQTGVLGILNKEVSDNSVIVCAAGSLPGDLQRLWQCQKKDGYHLEYGYSCMGYEVAGGLGVKLAQPDREIWVAVGDGSFLMMHSELVTAICEGAKINVVLFDSVGFNCIKGLQCSLGSQGFGTDLVHRNKKTTKLDGAPIHIDYAGYAKALGVSTWRASDYNELRNGIKEARACDNSTLIEVKVGVGTQSQGYDTWWRVEVADTSSSDAVRLAQHEMDSQTAKARIL